MELLVGNVKGKTAILVDDMIDTGHTVSLASNMLKGAGAEKIYVIASHGALNFMFPPFCWVYLTCMFIGLFAETNIPYLTSLPIERLIVTNSIPQSSNRAASNNRLEILDVSATISESIRRSHNGESFSILFGENPEGLK